MMKTIKFLIGVFFFGHVSAYMQEATAHIQSFLTHYTRPITLIECGADAHYVPTLAHNNNMVCVMYLTACSNSAAVTKKLRDAKLHNMVLLNPAKFGIHELVTLGRCEHFEVSIIDEDFFDGLTLKEALPALLRLGDYLFCIVNEESVALVQEAAQALEIRVVITDIVGTTKKICRCESLKKGLDIARWNMYRMPMKEYERYAICSNFHTKTLRKGSTHSTWLPGINMVTFVGCRGLLPGDTTILAMLGALKKVDHNDLVIGNMIIQGNKIAIIDFEDARRNVRRSKCIRVAQDFFKSGMRFKKTPEEALEDYKHAMRKRRFID